MSNINKIESLQQILKEDSSNFQVRRQLAVLLLDSGFSEEALQHFLYLARIFPQDSGIFYNLGIVYEKLKDLDKAEANYIKAILYAPEEADAYYNLGLVYMDKKDYDKAIENFEKVLEIDIDDSNAYFSIGLSYFKQDKKDAAKYYFQRTVELNDEDIYAHFYLGNLYKDEGDIEAAQAAFYKVLELSPDYSWAYYNLAVIDYEHGDLEGASKKLMRTLELNPKDIEAYKVYAKVLAREQMYDHAEAVLQQAVNYCGANGDLYYILAQVYKHQGKRAEYEKNMNLALKNHATLSVSPRLVKQELST